jgi:nitrilase
MRKPEGREAFRRYHEGAIDLAGPEVATIAEATAETGAFVVIGVIERDGGTVYCTALFFDGDKGLIAKHRKLMPTGAERLIWGFGDGSTMPVIDTQLGKIGAVICWENYMPMMRMAMYDQGITIYCAPTADDRDGWAASMRHIALEGRCFVLSACQHITRGAYPADYDCALGDDPKTVLMRGGSMIVAPLGEVLAGPDYAGETILYAEIDPDAVVRGKYDFDVAGHYARPDIFQLKVNVARQSAVSRVGSED